MYILVYFILYIYLFASWQLVVFCGARCQRHVYVYVVYLGLCVVFDRYQRRISGEKL